MHYDYLIIGAGPAGLQLGYFLQREGRSFLIVEAGEKAGSFFEKFPRHRQLISINKVNTGFDDSELNLRWDWNSLLNEDLWFPDYTERYFPQADLMVRYLRDFSEKYRLPIEYGTRITRVSRNSSGFDIESEAGKSYRCSRLVVATGLFKLRMPSFPGVSLAQTYSDCSVDPMDFKGKRVLVVGKGNSALETADNLVETTASVHLCSPSPIKLAWASHFVGNVRAVNNNFLDTYQLKSQNVILDAEIDSLEKKGDRILAHITYTHAKGETRTIPYDHVILATGFTFDTEMFDDSCRPELAMGGRLPAMTVEWESANVPDLFFAGSLMQMRDYKKTMSGFIHGFRYNILALSRILGQRYHGGKWPVAHFPFSPRATALRVIDRLNRSSSIFLQPGFFGDMIVDRGDGTASYLKDLPLEYILDSELTQTEAFFTISLEYGDYGAVRDPFNIARDPDPAQAHLIEYLHPIIRKYRRGELVNEHHLVEDVENDYSAERYIDSVAEYLARESRVPATPDTAG